MQEDIRMTVFVGRTNGMIATCCNSRTLGLAEEELSSDNPEVVAYMAAITSPVEEVAVSSRQFKLQLLASGLLDEIDAWVASQSREVQIAYEYSGTFVKDSPTMAAGFQAMGFTAPQIDEFFAAASRL